ncbi:MAG: hydrogenase accessory protein HypB [Chloroflexi bacterium]|nr:MAG: hydrogenase accessory protein HypB [Chloroflexota bacterium]RLC97070.1 MAG: hydrogenase accessory protein HypB [Chloroflexota bacterium]
MEIKVVKDILSVNDQMAERNRAVFEAKGLSVINIMSSPGSGKTSLILETVRRLKGKVGMAVVEGDISSSIDAEKISQEQVPVVQINTGGECHLDAGMINRALDSLPLDDIRLLLIENVGNLVCPGEFNLGESKKVLILSVPEGDDKVYKYPLMFSIADLVLVNKVDLLAYTRFDVERLTGAVRAINQRAEVLRVSCTTGEGIDDWVSWVQANLGL